MAFMSKQCLQFAADHLCRGEKQLTREQYHTGWVIIHATDSDSQTRGHDSAVKCKQLQSSLICSSLIRPDVLPTPHAASICNCVYTNANNSIFDLAP